MATNNVKSGNNPQKPLASKNTPKSSKLFAFEKENYILFIASVVLVIVGFVLMTGTSGNIFDFRRITLAPIIVLLGFGLGIYAIFYTKKNNTNNSETE